MLLAGIIELFARLAVALVYALAVAGLAFVVASRYF